MSFARLQRFTEEMYERKYNQLTPQQQENHPSQIPLRCSYPLSKRFDLNLQREKKIEISMRLVKLL